MKFSWIAVWIWSVSESSRVELPPKKTFVLSSLGSEWHDRPEFRGSGRPREPHCKLTQSYTSEEKKWNRRKLCRYFTCSNVKDSISWLCGERKLIVWWEEANWEWERKFREKKTNVNINKNVSQMIMVFFLVLVGLFFFVSRSPLSFSWFPLLLCGAWKCICVGSKERRTLLSRWKGLES